MEYVNIETDDLNKTAIIWMNSPPGNSFTQLFLEELSNVLRSFENQSSINSLILSSKLKVFSVGGDLGGMKEGFDQNKPELYVENIVPLVNQLILQILSHPLPIISAINGSVAGGGLSVALSCDYRLASENAKFAFAFGKLALTPDSCTSVLLPQRFGKQQAFFGIVEGSVLSSKQVLDKGAIHQVVSSMELKSKALGIASSFILSDQWATAKTKELLNKSLIDQVRFQSELEYQTIMEASKRSETQSRIVSMLNSVKK